MGRIRTKASISPSVYLGYYSGTNRSYNLDSVTYVDSCSDSLHSGPPYLTGGPLAIAKTKREVIPSQWEHFSANNLFADLRFLPSVVKNLTVNYNESSLSGWGAKGWARYQPAKPIYEFGVSIFELRDLPSMLLQTKRFFAKLAASKFWKLHKNPAFTVANFVKELKAVGRDGLGSDYLNLQFGWVPFISDLIAAYNVQANLRKKLEFLKRNNRKSVRRRGQVSSYSNRWTDSVSYPGPGTLTPNPTTSICLNAAGNQIETIMEYSRQIWFSAKFTYFIPELEDRNNESWGLFRLKLSLLGLTLNARSIYKAVPWTWLLDWFTNVGDVVTNITNNARYHVVASYAYIMSHERVKCLNIATGSVNKGIPWNVSANRKPLVVNGQINFLKEWKRREAANPYGFGLTLGSLNSYQLGILVALGLTRL